MVGKSPPKKEKCTSSLVNNEKLANDDIVIFCQELECPQCKPLEKQKAT